MFLGYSIGNVYNFSAQYYSRQTKNKESPQIYNDPWYLGTPHNQRTRDHDSGVGVYLKASSNESSPSSINLPSLSHSFQEENTPFQ